MADKGFTLRLGKALYSFGMPNTLADRVTGGDIDRLSRPIDVLELSVVDDGFLFTTSDSDGNPEHDLKYEPNAFAEFKEHLQTMVPGAWPAALKLKTNSAAQILHLFFQWMNDKFSESVEGQIADGELAFEDVREFRKELFDVPRFQSFLSRSFASGNLPKRAKGKRRKHNQAVEDLYALACRMYKETPELSWEAACFNATQQRPDLIPPSWQADPDGNLKREASRYWDDSMYSQREYRLSRDV